jgi:hypothetical protein
MTLLTYTLAPDVPSSPVRSRHAPWVGHAVSAIAVVAAGLLGALAGVLIGLVAGILLAGPEATRLMTLGGEELNIISRGLRAVARDVPDGRSPPTVRAPTSHASHRNLTDGAKTACNDLICSGTTWHGRGGFTRGGVQVVVRRDTL